MALVIQLQMSEISVEICINELQTEQGSPPILPKRLLMMGLLTVCFPYIFVWFIQKADYPRAFRLWLTLWSAIWISSAILFFGVNIAWLNLFPLK